MWVKRANCPKILGKIQFYMEKRASSSEGVQIPLSFLYKYYSFILVIRPTLLFFYYHFSFENYILPDPFLYFFYYLLHLREINTWEKNYTINYILIYFSWKFFLEFFFMAISGPEEKNSKFERFFLLYLGIRNKK